MKHQSFFLLHGNTRCGNDHILHVNLHTQLNLIHFKYALLYMFTELNANKSKIIVQNNHCYSACFRQETSLYLAHYGLV